MKPVVRIMLLLAVAALSCNKKEAPPASQPNPYKYNVRLREALTITDYAQQRVASRKFSYNKDGYLSRYRYVDSTIGNPTAEVKTEIVYLRGLDNMVLMELQTFNSGKIHTTASHHYNPDGTLIKVIYYRENSLKSTTEYKWENGKLINVYLSDRYFQFIYSTDGNLRKLTQFEDEGNNTYVHLDNAEFDNHVNVWTMIPGMANPFAIANAYPEYYSANNITNGRIIGGRTATYTYEYDAEGYVTKSHNFIYNYGHTSYSITSYFYESAE